MKPLEETRLQELLVSTSRTFAVSIPVLEQPLRHQVTLAYLLFRIGDTLEDAHRWPVTKRVGELEWFASLLEETDRGCPGTQGDQSDRETRLALRADQWLSGTAPTEHPGYLDLLKDSPEVLRGVSDLPEAAQALIEEHTQRTCRGMAEFVGSSGPEGQLQLETLEDLQRYCYVVAGIVGELLTELFVLNHPALSGVAGELRARSVSFGEALQLVNILKDATADAEEGRFFLPELLKADELLLRARKKLSVAAEYVTYLEQAQAPPGILAFTALPAKLAEEALDAIESEGPGAKVPRLRVLELVQQVLRDVELSRPLFPVAG